MTRYGAGVAIRCAVAVAVLASAPAGAAQCSAQASAVEFGVYDPFSPVPNDSVGMITLRCTGIAGESVAYLLRIGTGDSGVFAPRTMRGGAGSLLYNLYTNAARTLIWGDGTGSSRVVSDAFVLPGPAITRSYPVYGRMPGRQNVAPGTYTDLLILTLDY